MAFDTAIEPPVSRNMESNVLAMLLGTMVTGGLGLVYWGLAARLFSPAEVGRASAIINATLALAIISTLSMGAVFERFLLPAGRLAPRMVGGAMVLTGAVGVPVAAGYAFLNRNSPIFDGPWSIQLMPLWVVVIMWFFLTEQLCAALLVARWGAAKNALHSAVKVGALFPAAALGTAMSIVLTWMIPAAVLLVVVGWMAVRRLRASGLLEREPRLPPRSELVRYAGSTMWLMVLANMAPLLIPLIVVGGLGLEANAYFAVAWALVSAVLAMMAMIGGPLVAEVVSDPDNVSSYMRRFSVIAGGMAVAGGIGVAFGGPVLMGLINAEYQAQTTTALRLFGAAIPFMVVSTLFVPLSRVVRRLRVAMVCQAITVAIFLGGGWLTLSRFGIDGLAASFLAAEALNSVMLIGPLTVLVRRIRANGVEQPELADRLTV
ncbi:lipopolysaccharide biosynthesis protein [Dietzia maris]